MIAAGILNSCDGTGANKWKSENMPELIQEARSGSIPQELLQSAESSGEGREQVIRGFEKAANKDCPMEVDDGLVLTEVYYSSGYFVYDYVVDEELWDMDIMRSDAGVIRENMASQYTPDQISLFRSYGIGLKSVFTGNITGTSFTVKVNQSEL